MSHHTRYNAETRINRSFIMELRYRRVFRYFINVASLCSALLYFTLLKQYPAAQSVQLRNEYLPSAPFTPSPTNPTSRLSLARLLMGISHPIRPYLLPFSPIYRSALQTRKPQTLITKRPISGCGSTIGRLEYSTQRRVKSDSD